MDIQDQYRPEQSGSDQYGTLTSKCVTMASISSSQNGGLASKEPLTGENIRNGLKTNTDRSQEVATVYRCLWMCWMSVSPSGSKEAIDVGEGGAELFEIAVERRGETLEGNSELPVQRLKHGHRQRPLQAGPLISTAAKHLLDTQRHLINQLTGSLANTDRQLSEGKS